MFLSDCIYSWGNIHIISFLGISNDCAAICVIDSPNWFWTNEATEVWNKNGFIEHLFYLWPLLVVLFAKSLLAQVHIVSVSNCSFQSLRSFPISAEFSSSARLKQWINYYNLKHVLPRIHPQHHVFAVYNTFCGSLIQMEESIFSRHLMR